MKILNDLNELKKINDKLGVTVGNFDGVHLGHQTLLKNIKNECSQNGHKLLVFTFIPHPKLILSPSEHLILNSYAERRILLENLGVDYLFEISFTRDFSTKPPEWFLTEYIKGIPAIESLFLGHDFAFGADKKGSHSLAQKVCATINVVVCEEFFKDHEKVSSSHVRELIAEGQVEEAKSLLNRVYFVAGRVIKGDGRGRQMGFPTANIFTQHERLLPKRGVYITQTVCGGVTYNSITNIGFNPTFQIEKRINVETNIFDFDKDIYGEEITVFFFKRLREEKKFNGIDSLIKQIEHDVLTAQRYFKT